MSTEPSVPASSSETRAATGDVAASKKTSQQLLGDALTQIKRLKAELAAVKHKQHMPIAVVGMSCRYPGGVTSPDTFWKLLRDGVNGISEIEDNRWDIEDIYDPNPQAAGRIYTKSAGLLQDIEKFDAELFGITPLELQCMDPQHRVFMEATWCCIENAGYAPSMLAGQSVGIYVGVSTQDFSQLSSRFCSAETITPWNGTGVSFSAVGGRLAYLLDLHGPAVPVDTACSSSLVALHQAVNGLRQLECDAALVGGVNLMLNPATSILFCKAMMLSPDGRCKTFDADADGYARGEGCGVVMLKRLDDAVRDGDNVLALIRGTAVNQDGRTQGLTAPNESAQVDVIRRALANAVVEPHNVSYIEAHGTGTSLGDPIEMAALATAYCTQREQDNPLWVGSLKTNVGHMEAAAGVGGLQKVILALQHQSIPPHINFTTPSTYIDWQSMPQVRIPVNFTPWQTTAKPRIAGLSSFGFTGTNAHVVIEQAPPQVSSQAAPGARLFKLSGTRLAALRDSIRNHIDWLASDDSQQDMLQQQEDDATRFARICHTANRARNDFRFRLAIVADDIDDLTKQLHSLAPVFDACDDDEDVVFADVATAVTQAATTCLLQKAAGKLPATAWLFAGQGSQRAGMAHKLYQQLPLFRNYFDQCATLFAQHTGVDLPELIWGDKTELLAQTQYTQPALFALEYALARVFFDGGIKPSLVMGHSVGEYAAACIAGVFSLADAMKLICARGRLMHELTQTGGMTAVFADEAQLNAVLVSFPQLAIAVRNAETNLVVGGDFAALTALEMQLAARDIKYRRLQVSHAFHTAMMQPMLAAFAEIAATVSYRVPRIRFVSTVTGTAESARLATPQYWVEQVMACVNFSAALRAVLDTTPDNLLEIGPDRTLCALARQMTTADKPALLATQMPQQELRCFHTALANLYCQGHAIDWHVLHQGAGLRSLLLPNYAFQRRVFWHPEMPAPKGRIEHDENTLLQRKIYRHEWQKKALLPRMEDNPAGDWLVLCADENRSAIVAALAQSGQTATCLCQPHSDAATLQRIVADWLAGPAMPVGILLAWHINDSADSGDDSQADNSAMAAQRFYTATALHVLKALIALKPQQAQRQLSKLPLWFYAGGSARHAFTEQSSQQRSSEIMQRGIWGGIVNVIALEHPEFLGGYIEADAFDADAIVLELMQGDSEDQIRYLQGQRFVTRLRHAENAQLPQQPLHIVGEGAYLVSGGLGSLGLGVALTLAQAGARHLVLPSRKGFDAATASAAQNDVMQQLHAMAVEVSCPVLDVGDRTALAALIAGLNASPTPLRGVVHAAGVFDLTAIAELDEQRCADIMDGKIQGGWNLHQLTQNCALDFFVNFSSIASVWGSAGNFHYAAANHVLDVIAEQRLQLNLPVTNINWGPWAQSTMALHNEDEAAKRGLIPLDMQQGLAIFARLVGGESVGNAVVADVQWSQFLQLMQLRGRRPLFDGLGRDAARPAAMSSYVRIGLLQTLLPLDEIQRTNAITAYLADQISAAAGIERNHFDIDAPLLGFGLDSLMALELRNRVKIELDTELPVSLLLEGASTSVLAGHLYAALALPPASSEQQVQQRLSQEQSLTQQLIPEQLLPEQLFSEQEMLEGEL